MPRKIPSYLKGLRDARARADGDIRRLTALVEAMTTDIRQAQATLDACDILIRKFDANLDPSTIPPNRGLGRVPAPRGALKSAIVEYLQERYPAEITTGELTRAMQVQFKMDFDSWEALWKWQHGSLTRRLKKLLDEGLVERLHDPMASTGEAGRWRWKSETDLSPDRLRERAEAAGVAVRESDGDPD